MQLNRVQAAIRRTVLALAVSASGLGVAQEPAAPAPETPAVEERFDVSEYRVLGNTMLEALAIERAVYPHLGTGKSIADVETARVALEKTYRDAGYATIFVDIPEQDVDAGIVRLRVTEGRLDRVRVSEARYFSARQIRAELPSLERGAIPNFNEFQRELSVLNRRTADRAVTPVLRAGATPGTVDVQLRVDDALPVQGSVEVNDRYTVDTSRTRVNVELGYANLFRRFHSLSLQYQTAPEERQEARVVAATYLAPFSEGNNILAVYGVDTNSDVATLGTLSVLGAGRIYGSRWIRVLPGSGQYFHNFSFGPDWKDFEENVQITEEDGLVTPIEYVNWSLGYTGNVRTDHTTSSFTLAAGFGLRGLANDAEEFELKRLNAQPTYMYWRLDAQHERALWRGTRFFTRLAGQFAVEPLISNEQFSIGGAESVRGYLESEVLGDYGLAGSVELRSKSWSFGRPNTEFYVFTFFDAGVTRILDALPQQPAQADLSSWGAGLRFAGLGGLVAALDWADPLVPSDNTAAEDSRLHFAIRYGF